MVLVFVLDEQRAHLVQTGELSAAGRYTTGTTVDVDTIEEHARWCLSLLSVWRRLHERYTNMPAKRMLDVMTTNGIHELGNAP